MSWLSGKPIDSQLGGARFKSTLALLVYIYMSIHVFIYLFIYLFGHRMTDDTGYRRSPDFGSVAGCQFRLPFGRRMPYAGYRSVTWSWFRCRMPVTLPIRFWFGKTFASCQATPIHPIA